MLRLFFWQDARANRNGAYNQEGTYDSKEGQ
jgi:hypothetical protein